MSGFFVFFIWYSNTGRASSKGGQGAPPRKTKKEKEKEKKGDKKQE